MESNILNFYVNFVAWENSEMSIIIYLNVVVFSCKDKNICLCILGWAQMSIRWQSYLLLRILLNCVNLQNLVKKLYLYLYLDVWFVDGYFIYVFLLFIIMIMCIKKHCALLVCLYNFSITPGGGLMRMK